MNVINYTSKTKTVISVIKVHFSIYLLHGLKFKPSVPLYTLVSATVLYTLRF